MDQVMLLVPIVLAGMAAIVLLAAGAFVAVRGSRSSLAVSKATSAKRLTLVIAAALLLAFAVSYVTAARASNTQTFALSGAERWTVGPFLYVAFAALLVSASHDTLRTAAAGLLKSPTGGLVVLVLISGFIGMLLDATTPVQTAQGLALIVGFALFMTVGSMVKDWDLPMKRLFTGVVVAAAAATMLLGTGLGSFPALAVPAAAAVIVLWRSPSLPLPARVAAIVIGVGAIVRMYYNSAGSNDPSAGLELQMAFAASIVVVALLPRRLRAVAGVLLCVGIVVAIAQSPLGQLTVGGLAEDPDPTLAQRGYETQAVWELVSRSPLSLLFGIGPGATVDLTKSPDAATLLASGRDLAHVPSVHLLTSHVLLKAGLLGLLWLASILVALFTLTVAELRQPRPEPFVVLLLCLPWCGLAAATPAATFFFSNPLCALGIGLLVGRAATRRAGVPDGANTAVLLPHLPIWVNVGQSVDVAPAAREAEFAPIGPVRIAAPLSARGVSIRSLRLPGPIPDAERRRFGSVRRQR